MKKLCCFFIVVNIVLLSVNLILAQQIEVKSKVEAYKKLGKEYWDQKLYEKSEAEYKKALELEPQNEDVLIGLGTASHAQGKYDEAIIWYKKALSINPKSPRALNNLADAYLRKGDYEKAKDHVLKALELKPDMAVARTTLGEIYLAQGYYSCGLKEFQKALPNAEQGQKEFIQSLINETEKLMSLQRSIH